MKLLLSHEIPILPMKAVVNNESIALGVGDPGIIVQYMDRDECILIDWNDIVFFGIELLKIQHKQDKPAEPEEIDKPTVKG